MRLTALARLAVSIVLAVCFTHIVQAQSQTGAPVTVEPFRSTNVRSGPSVNFDVIDILQQGQIIEATGRSDTYSNWIQVNLGARRGWVAYFTVAVSGDITTLPIVDVPPVTATPPAEGEIPQEASTDVFVTAYRRVNVRTGPGTDFEVIGALVAGQTADIIGTSGNDNEWLQINFNGEPGWIAYFVVTVSGELSNIDPTTAATLLQDSTATIDDNNAASVLNQVIVITRFNTNLREEPILGSEVVAVIPYETTLQAVARTEDSRWLRVRYEDHVGWLISSLVNMGVSDIEALPTTASTGSVEATAS